MKNNKRKYWIINETCPKDNWPELTRGRIYPGNKQGIYNTDDGLPAMFFIHHYPKDFRPATNNEIIEHLSEPENKVFEEGDVFVRIPTSTGPDGEMGIIGNLDENLIRLCVADYDRFGIDIQNTQHVRLATPDETTAFERGVKNINDMFNMFQDSLLKEEDTTKSATMKFYYPTLKKEDLYNTKIWIGNDPELCKSVQQVFFATGLEWSISGKKIVHINSTALYVNSLFISQTDYKTKKDHFEARRRREITPADLGIQWPQQPVKPVLDHDESFAYLFESFEERRDFIDWCLEHEIPVGAYTKELMDDSYHFENYPIIRWNDYQNKIFSVGLHNKHNRLLSLNDMKARFFPGNLTTDDVLAGFDNIPGVPSSYLGLDPDRPVGVAGMRITTLPPVRIHRAKPLPLPVAPEPLPAPLLKKITRIPIS